MSKLLNVFKGPEFNLLNTKAKKYLFKTKFTIRANNRMAYNLEEKLPVRLKSIVSSPVLPGSVQLTPSGKIIILHRDCQTSGGYPRILQLDKKSLNHLSQLKSNEKIKFNIINL